MSHEEHIKSSKADVWYLKEITFGSGDSRKNTKIITQNFNGYVPHVVSQPF